MDERPQIRLTPADPRYRREDFDTWIRQQATPAAAFRGNDIPGAGSARTAHIRPATLADTEGIGLAHVRSWQSAYRGKMPQDYLDGLDPAVRGGPARSSPSTWTRTHGAQAPGAN